MNQEHISNLISEAKSLSKGDLDQRFIRKEGGTASSPPIWRGSWELACIDDRHVSLIQLADPRITPSASLIVAIYSIIFFHTDQCEVAAAHAVALVAAAPLAPQPTRHRITHPFSHTPPHQQRQ